MYSVSRNDRPPVLAAWGAGTDSTAMLIEMIESGQPVDHVLHADVGWERKHTEAFRPIFQEWLAGRGVPCTIVKYSAKNFKHWPPYKSLLENCVSNATLPSIAFGRHSCSSKWKVQPQDKWTETWEPAQAAWASGQKVIKLIGYDAGPRDSVRYAQREGHVDDRYEIRTPLREWGWTREDCIRRIDQAGLPQPGRSSCVGCLATQPWELHELTRLELRLLVLVEARAAPRLLNVEGLWRSTVKGTRGGTPRPGSMTQYIREQGLLPSVEIDRIIALAPPALVRWQDVASGIPVDQRPAMSQWLEVFNLAGENDDAPLYVGLADQLVRELAA